MAMHGDALWRAQLAEECKDYLRMVFLETRQACHKAAVVSPQEAIKVHYLLKAMESIEKVLILDIRHGEITRDKMNKQEAPNEKSS